MRDYEKKSFSDLSQIDAIDCTDISMSRELIVSMNSSNSIEAFRTITTKYLLRLPLFLLSSLCSGST